MTLTRSCCENKIAKSDLIDTTTKWYCKILRTDISKLNELCLFPYRDILYDHI